MKHLKLNNFIVSLSMLVDMNVYWFGKAKMSRAQSYQIITKLSNQFGDQIEKIHPKVKKLAIIEYQQTGEYSSIFAVRLDNNLEQGSRIRKQETKLKE